MPLDPLQPMRSAGSVAASNMWLAIFDQVSVSRFNKVACADFAPEDPGQCVLHIETREMEPDCPRWRSLSGLMLCNLGSVVEMAPRWPDFLSAMKRAEAKPKTLVSWTEAP